LRLPIIAGPLRGRWWLVTSRGKVLRILNGTYEREQTRLFAEWIRPGDTVLDVGAHVGYYSLLASVLAGDGGTVWAFEPDPRNFSFLELHARINGRSNIRAERAAVSDANGTARFGLGSGSGTGHLAEDGALAVRTIRLDDFCRSHDIRPAAVKIDVEGAEVAVLAGARELLASARPVIFLSTHGPDVHRHCLHLLRELGYDFQPIVGGDIERATELLCLPGGATRDG
jgi:FkbM family methyltransferase